MPRGMVWTTRESNSIEEAYAASTTNVGMGLLKPSESLRKEVPITSAVMAKRSKTEWVLVATSANGLEKQWRHPSGAEAWLSSSITSVVRRKALSRVLKAYVAPEAAAEEVVARQRLRVSDFGLRIPISGFGFGFRASGVPAQRCARMAAEA